MLLVAQQCRFWLDSSHDTGNFTLLYHEHHSRLLEGVAVGVVRACSAAVGRYCSVLDQTADFIY
jgi:hypothetical protein